MLLMLVILGIFISSSEAETTCVQCASLLSQSCGRDPYSESSSHSTCSADFCVKSKYQYRGDVRFVICLYVYVCTTAAAAAIPRKWKRDSVECYIRIITTGVILAVRRVSPFFKSRGTVPHFWKRHSYIVTYHTVESACSSSESELIFNHTLYLSLIIIITRIHGLT